MTKKQRALEIIERLKKEYPDADCTLDYEEAWKLLVSVRLAAQCTDARVNVVVQGCLQSIRMWMHWQQRMWMTLNRLCARVVLGGVRREISAHV